MEKENLIIAYCGAALKNHEIDIEELAVSLTGIAGVLKQAGAIANKGQNCKITVKVSSLEPGSFELHLVTEQIKEVLSFWGTNPNVIGLATLLSLLGFTGTVSAGLIQFILKLKNSKVKKVEELPNNEIKITYIDNSETKNITINKNVYNFYNDIDLRTSLNKVLSPLKSNGIDSLEIRDSSKNVKEEITKTDLQYFDINSQNDFLDANIIDMWLSFLSISFKDGNKWRFAYGDSEFYATMEDEEFLNNVDNNSLSFSKSDAIKAQVKIEQYLTEKGIKTEYKILKILEYKSVAQLRLDLYSKNNENEN